MPLWVLHGQTEQLPKRRQLPALRPEERLARSHLCAFLGLFQSEAFKPASCFAGSASIHCDVAPQKSQLLQAPGCPADGRSESQGNVMDVPALPSLKPSHFLSQLLCYGVLVGEKVAPRGAAKGGQSALSDGLSMGGRLMGWHVCCPQSTDQQAPRQPREAVAVGVGGFPVLHEAALAGSG